MHVLPGALLKQTWFNMRWEAEHRFAQWRNREMIAFYEQLFERGYCPERFIRIIADPKMIYIAVSKAASTRVKAILSEVAGQRSRTLGSTRKEKFRESADMRRVGFHTFYQMAIGADTLRFSFVRNPYERLVSCWANKFQGLPLIPGQSKKLDIYLNLRKEIDRRLPAGADQTMSFSDFVIYATQTHTRRLDQHWNLQTDVLEMPGIRLDIIGKVENFASDVSRILHDVPMDAELRARVRERVAQPLNPSARGRCAQYFSPELVDMAYRAYEKDFDKLGYPRALPE
jgi:hypothetical protein